jgi:hypothetical protein
MKKKKLNTTTARRADAAAIRRAKRHAYHRAADLAKSYAGHWEAAARAKQRRGRPLLQEWTAELKAGHWRIIEKAIRDLARRPEPVGDT